MPGIAGLIAPPQAPSPAALARTMVETMRHEPFYRAVLLAEPRLGLAGGWCGPSTPAPATAAAWNARRDIALLCGGEDFADPQALDVPPGLPHAQALIEAYERHGPAFLARLNGTLSGLLVDLRDDTVRLFSDRFGLNRLFVAETADTVLFAHEAKALLAALPGRRALEAQALGEWLSCGCPLQGRSLFPGITLMPPGTVWTFRGGRVADRSRYFDLSAWESLPALSPAEFEDALDHHFPHAVRRLLGEGVGMSLTGGLDGRMIMACVPPTGDRLPCYSFAGPVRDCADAALARRVAQASGQPHQVLRVDDDFLARFASLAERAVALSDGSLDVTGAVELHVNAMAREVAPVRLTGNYGSEVLRGNVAFGPAPVDTSLYAPELAPSIAQAAATYAQEAAGRRLSLIVGKQVPWHHPARLSLEQTQVTMRSPYLDPELVKLAYRCPPELATAKQPALRFVARHRPALARIPTDRGLVEPPRPLWTRLHHLWCEAVFRAEYVWDYGMPHRLARLERPVRALQPQRLFLGRHKFYHFRVWYRDRLGEVLRERLLDPRTLRRGLFQPRRLEAIVREHLAGTHNHTLALHQALSLELLHRQLLECARPAAASPAPATGAEA